MVTSCWYVSRQNFLNLLLSLIGSGRLTKIRIAESLASKFSSKPVHAATVFGSAKNLLAVLPSFVEPLPCLTIFTIMPNFCFKAFRISSSFFLASSFFGFGILQVKIPALSQCSRSKHTRGI
eukprot:Pompholyxophrys_punicea_v1_NODE_1146_length_911_cov_2.289720.p3 type:complete len:122 gc:universal NODE_1146_length_911_cov_2.289720:48-413(+)